MEGSHIKTMFVKSVILFVQVLGIVREHGRVPSQLAELGEFPGGGRSQAVDLFQELVVLRLPLVLARLQKLAFFDLALELVHRILKSNLQGQPIRRLNHENGFADAERGTP